MKNSKSGYVKLQESDPNSKFQYVKPNYNSTQNITQQTLNKFDSLIEKLKNERRE